VEVRTWAARDSLPSGLVFALMKQESGFDPLAVSGAGARGLMQMMPATGALLAKQEMLSGFTADSLFNPGINIRLGVAYLRDLERRHHGDLYFTLAHYNAGPEALADWMPRLTGRSADQIAEDLGFAETREYVKRVLANYWTYQMLYE
jgi:soluble lytic murein transglycosylase